MGCGVSNEFVPPPQDPKEKALLEPFPNNGVTGNGHSGTAHHQSAAPPVEGKLLGKDKYIKSYGALCMDYRGRGGETQGMLFLFCPLDTDNLVCSYRDNQTGNVFARTYTDQELAEAKTVAGISFSWAPFFKSLATSILKGKATVSGKLPTLKDVFFTVTNSKDTTSSFPFQMPLELCSSASEVNPVAVHDYVTEPLTRYMQYNRCRVTSGERVTQCETLECELLVRHASIRKYKDTVDRLLPLIRPLREESAVCSHTAMVASRDVRDLERTINARMDRQVKKHPLDSLYDEGGAQFFQHTVWSVEHRPYEEVPDAALTACIRAAFPLPAGSSLNNISQVLDRVDIRKLVEEGNNRQVIVEAFEIFKGIDRWDYDTIQLEIITNGNALFYTTYLLMYKLDLVSYFGIDDATLCNFLVAVQAAYHPNPYHNAMHGADVTQINYYIMMVAGLAQKCQLSKEEILAGLISGAVHDFDHPGLNNNFHSRTNAYLATLYNDRSILENHHLACTFELLRNPRYNIFAPLSDAQFQSVRETMLEMVLATDMGNHAKIFKSFQVRMSEAADWHTKKEDVRLALSMSIKMADISNCARPNHIYAEWAKNISKEFYLQGDAERKLKLSISPFMDRTKEAEEFPKGQISFMMYIVQPMVEAISALLPSLSFAVGLCQENKEYWTRKQEEKA